MPNRLSKFKSIIPVNCSGFTMVELVVVLVLFGVMLSLTIPAFSKSVRGLKVKTAVRKVVSILRYARSESVFKQTPLLVNFDLDNNFFWIEGEPVEDREEEPSATTVKIKLPSEVYIKYFEWADDKVDSGINTIWFYPDGSSSGAIVEIADKARDESYKIEVDLFTGLPQVFLDDE